MKRCPFCAEEIQDAAIVCKHCNRDLPVAIPDASPTVPAARSRSRYRWVWWAGGISLLLIVVLALGQPADTVDSPASGGDVLRVTAGKGVGGFAVTNIGDQGILECEVSAENDAVEWIAELRGYLHPNQTARVDWDRFKSKGQSMPTYIGVNQRQFRVECSRADGTRRYANMRFDK